MVLQAFLVRDGRSLGNDFRIAVLQTHAHHALGLPEAHLLLQLGKICFFIDALPHIDGEGGFLLRAGAQKGHGSQKGKG